MRKVKIVINLLSISLILFAVLVGGMKYKANVISNEAISKCQNTIKESNNLGLVIRDNSGSYLVFDYAKKEVRLGKDVYTKIIEINENYIVTQKGSVSRNIELINLMDNQKLKVRSLDGSKNYYTLDYEISGLEEYNNLVCEEVSKIINEEEFKYSKFNENSFYITVQDNRSLCFGIPNVFTISDMTNNEFVESQLLCFPGYCS